ncbi:MAG TPA: hypothetical protein PLF79_07760, partial [Thauera sp.]|nr:hypothetical protein [Thauera sp.]
MAPNTRLRLIPLMLLCMSGASLADSLPPLKVSPDLLRGRAPAPVQSAPQAVEAAPAMPVAPVAEPVPAPAT